MVEKTITTPEMKLYEEIRVIILMGINDVRDEATKKIKLALNAAYLEGKADGIAMRIDPHASIKGVSA